MHLHRIHILLVILFVISGRSSFAQKLQIGGHVMDTLNIPLPGATILLLNPVDSSLVNFTVSDGLGKFTLKNIVHGDHLLKITFVGYQPFLKLLNLRNTVDPLIDIGEIQMQPYRQQLDEVIVEAYKAPVRVKGDTIEFNAGSFKTVPNSNVEDLLKKLPGVEVDNEGNITAQGEQVQSITVDGKNFFGRDPKIASKNLPADAVEKVQVFNKKSDQAEFTGIDDGNREKTINLELKEEKRKGAFGSLKGGLGTEDHFTAKASLNKFTKGNQLSLLGTANNINDQGFSVDDYLNFTGGSQQMLSGGRMRVVLDGETSNIPLNMGNRVNGLMTTLGAGANINREFSKNTELNGSYFYNFLDHEILQNTYRENYLPQGSFMYSEVNRQDNTNENHRINFSLDHKIDSANSLKLTSYFTHNQTDASLYSISESMTSDGEIQNESERETTNTGTNLSFNSDLLFRHRFNKKNRTLSANILFRVQQADRQGTLDAVNRYFSSGIEETTINQNNYQTTDNLAYGATLSYTEPLGNRKYLEVNYSYQQKNTDSNKEVYDITNDLEEFNEILSNLYSSQYEYQRAGLNFRLNRNYFNLTAGLATQYTNLRGDLELLDVIIDQSFKNLMPSARFNYDFSNSKHLNFDYETSMQEPTIQQLQPVIDNSDPLNVYEGNPALKPSYQHSWRVNYISFDPGSFVSFFTFADIDYTTNAITNSRWTTPDLVTYTKPVNVDDALNIYTNATFAFPINKIKSRLSISGNWRDNRSTTLLNDQPNEIIQQSAGGNVRYNYAYKEVVDVSLNAQLSHQKVKYEFDQPDQTYFNQTYTAESNVSFLKNYKFTATLEYLLYKSASTDFKQEIPLLDLSISRYILKNKAGEIKFSASNLLDKPLGINQTASINYLERTTTNSLGRYFMISFTYALNKQLNPMGFRRPGGALRIIRP